MRCRDRAYLILGALLTLPLLAGLLGDSAAGLECRARSTEQDTGKKPEGKDPAAGKGRQLLDAVVKASGGKERFAKLESLAWKSSEIVDPNGSNLRRTQDAVVVFPLKMRIETQVQGQAAILCLDGEAGWQSRGGLVEELIPERVQELHKSLLVSTTPLLKNHAELEAEELEGTEYQGKTYRHLRVRRGANGPVDFHVDPDTMRIFHRKATIQTAAGVVTREEVLEDYRQVAGMWLPFSRTIYENGKETVRITTIEFKLNVEISTEHFKKPGDAGR